MKKSKCFGIACSYIGAVIGAGFATGREVMLYFGKYGIISAVIAGFVLGVLAVIFLWSAKAFSWLKNTRSKTSKIIFVTIKICLYISTLLTFLCMISACEEIISNTFKIKNVGLWTGILVALLGLCDMGVLQKTNAIIVPMILVFLLVLASHANTPQIGKINLLSIVNYCGMNIMTGGYLLSEQSENLKFKDMLAVGVISGIFFAGSLALVYAIAMDYVNFSMPIFEFSKIHNLEYASGIVIYLAILTTLIGCSKLVCQENQRLKLPKILSMCLLFCIIVSGIKLDFAQLVAKTYPIIGYGGMVYICVASILGIVHSIVKMSASTIKNKNAYKHRFIKSNTDIAHNKLTHNL